MPRYKHPPAVRVLKNHIALGPYTEGEQFNAEELDHGTAQRLLDEGYLVALDEFGDEVGHEHPEPFAEPVEPEPEPAPKKSAAKAKK